MFLTKTEAKNLDSFVEYTNWRYEYKDKDGKLYIIENGVSLLDSCKDLIEVTIIIGETSMMEKVTE